MDSSFRIDEIARRLLERVPPAVRSMQQDLESNFRAVLRERLSKLDLVSRDEFDAQSRVLERTRSRLEALEKRLAELEEGGPKAASPPRPEVRGTAPGATAPSAPCGRRPASPGHRVHPSGHPWPASCPPCPGSR